MSVMFVRLGVCIVPFRVALCVRRGTDSRWRNVVPPTLPASCGIESARFRCLRVGGMPGRLSGSPLGGSSVAVHLCLC